MKSKAFSVLRYFVLPYPWFLGGILLAILVSSFLEGLHVAAFFPLFSVLLKEGSAGDPGRLLGAMSSVSRHLPFRNPVLSALFLLMGVTVIKNVSLLFRESLVARASGRVQHDIRNQLMECYAHWEYLSLLDRKQGGLIYHTSVGASRVGILIQKIAQLCAEGFKVAAIALFLIVTLPLATGALAAVGVGYYWLTHVLSRRISYHTGTGRVIAGSEQTSIVNEFLNGIRQITVFGTHPAWLKRFRAQSEVFRNLYVKDAFWLAVPKGLLELSVIGILCGCVLVFQMGNPSHLSAELGLIGVFAMAVLKLLPSLTVAGQLRMELSSLMADAKEVHRILTQMKPRPTGGKKPFVSLHTGIVLDSLRFAYPGREEILKGVQVTFEKGKRTGIVGPSGSGKSTLVNLLLGLFPPTGGRILVDGVDLNELQWESWRRRIGFVSQDAFIFHASVTENITFGREGRSVAAIEKAAQIANAHGFIQELPRGYETIVGERGMKLSGGQQQRLAIARAILDDPEILILDEATSSLDAESEGLIQEAIEKISLGRTVLLVAHRLSTIRRADKVAVLDEGRIVEEGRHEDLVSGQGRYVQLMISA